MSHSTISTFELFQMFPDNESAHLYLKARRWPDGATCPACGERERIYDKGNGFYRCNACVKRSGAFVFTVRTGTIFERSKVPLNKWLYAMYLLVTARKGISSLQLAKQIGITQKTAWFMIQRLQEACGNDSVHAGVALMSKKIKSILDAVTDKIFAYRPADKGKWAKKTESAVKQQAKRKAQSNE